MRYLYGREVMGRDDVTGLVKKSNVTVQPIIARFKSFRSRTKFYRNRKLVKDKFKYGIALDLTGERYNLLQRAKELVNEVDGIQFVYTDINCELRVLTSNGRHVKFDSVLDLQNIISNL